MEITRIANEVTRILMRLAEDACEEALKEREAHGWEAEPQVYAYEDDPFAGSVRITEGDEVVFERNFRVNVVCN